MAKSVSRAACSFGKSRNNSGAGVEVFLGRRPRRKRWIAAMTSPRSYGTMNSTWLRACHELSLIASSNVSMPSPVWAEMATACG